MHYQEYQWVNGAPQGLIKITPSTDVKSYKIVTDPYRKRISIERYEGQKFLENVYDSNFLDFRHLMKGELIAWYQELEGETEEQAVCLIRNQDDRVVFRETHLFEKGYCKKCLVHSLQGTLLSVHSMSYEAFGASENCVTLFDANEHRVMTKKYEVDEDGHFTDLISEEWLSS